MSKTVKLGMEHRKFAFDKEMEPAAPLNQAIRWSLRQRMLTAA